VTAGITAGALGVAGLCFTPVLGSREGHAHDVQDHGHEAAAGETDSGQAAGGTGHGHGGAGTGVAEPPPTAQQQAAADRLVTDTRAAVARFADIDQAVAAGYRPITPPGERIVHYGNPSYILDREVLNPQRVESLVYARTGRGVVLLGAMYMMPPGEKGPQIGGSLTHWHAHDDLCIDVTQLAQVARQVDGSCPAGSSVQLTPEMLHVWSVEYPGGPFAELTPLAAVQVLLSLH
jgi:hypothetical protein